MRTKHVKTKGFTIVELLTVMAVIAILIGLLIPALGLVRDNAKKVQQKAQFHSIDVGLELYKSEFGAYPESFDNAFEASPPTWKDTTEYCGANKLAEAMVGWDFLGFHPKSGFTSDGENDLNGDLAATLIYNPNAGFTEGSYTETADQNIEIRRKFIDLENANGFQMQDVYGTGNFGNFNADSVVLCDVYAKKRISSKKAGMPILYYRARSGYKFQDSTLESGGDSGDETDDEVYEFEDNESLLALNSADDSTILHPLYDTVGDLLDFEDIIVNQQVFDATDDGTGTTGIRQPYRADTYFLISAGKDGLYGTSDDILNFEKEITE